MSSVSNHVSADRGAKALQDEAIWYSKSAEEDMAAGWYKAATTALNHVLLCLEEMKVPTNMMTKALGDRCTCLRSSHLPRKAIKDAKRIALLDPVDPWNDFRLGVLHRELGNSRGAIEHLEAFSRHSDQGDGLCSVLLPFEKREWQTVINNAETQLQELEEEKMGQHVRDKVIIYTCYGLASAELGAHREALSAFEKGIDLLTKFEPDNKQELMELRIFYGLSCQALHRSGRRPIPDSFFTEGPSTFYRRYPTKADAASGLHALLGTCDTGSYYCPRARSTFTRKLQEHLQVIGDNAGDNVCRYLNDHLSTLWKEREHSREAALVFTGPVGPSIEEGLKSLEEEEISIRAKQEEIFEQIVVRNTALSGRIAQLYGNCSNGDFQKVDLEKRNAFFREYLEEVLEILQKERSEYHEELKKTLNAFEEVKKRRPQFFISVPGLLTAYFSACESETYCFSDLELQMGALLFNKKAKIFPKEGAQSPVEEGPFVPIVRQDNCYERWDEWSTNTYEEQARDSFRRLKQHDPHGEIFTDAFFDEKNASLVQSYYEWVKQGRLPTALDTPWKRWAALASLACVHQNGGKCLKVNPVRASLFYSMAAKLVRGFYATDAEAINEYDRILSIQSAAIYRAIIHYQVAQIYRKAGDHEQARSRYENAAKLNFSPASYRLGKMVHLGQIREKGSDFGPLTGADRLQAAEHLKRACLPEHHPLSGAAHHLLGVCYYEGVSKYPDRKDSSPDYTQALQCFSRAAEQEYKKSDLWLAWMSLYGQGVSKPNLKDAEKYATQASLESSTRQSALLCLKLIHSFKNSVVDATLLTTQQVTTLKPRVTANSQGDVVVCTVDEARNLCCLRGGKISPGGAMTWVGEEISLPLASMGERRFDINEEGTFVTVFKTLTGDSKVCLLDFKTLFVESKTPYSIDDKLIKSFLAVKSGEVPIVSVKEGQLGVRFDRDVVEKKSNDAYERYRTDRSDDKLTSSKNFSGTSVGKDQVLVVAEGANDDNRLYRSLIKIDSATGKHISKGWECYGVGKSPTVAFSQGQVLEFHECDSFEGPRLCRAIIRLDLLK